MGLGILLPLIGAHLDQVGFTGDQIGIVTASGTFVAVFAAPFWGQRYAAIESASRRYYLVAAIFVAAAVIALILPGLRSFIPFLLMFILLYVFQSPSASLMDALTIDAGEDFGMIRTFGALGFAVSCFGAAFLADRMGTFTMEVMKKVADKHNLACLLHEKPFDGVNGSGKHNNWSLITDCGENLLDPGKKPGIAEMRRPKKSLYPVAAAGRCTASCWVTAPMS